MAKTTLYIFTLLLPFLAAGQINLPVGQGVLKIDQTRLPIIHFFSDTTQPSPTRIIVVTRDKDGEYIFKNQRQLESWFMPEQVSLDYEIFIIRVDTVVGKWLRVVTNTEKSTFMWTKASAEIKFIRWETFLLNETTAIEKGFADLEVRTGPSSGAKLIKKMEVKDCFEVLEIQGDWMKIRTNTVLECSESIRPVKAGWIKWRDKGRLTIGFGLTC
jgi:hypothetical protein